MPSIVEKTRAFLAREYFRDDAPESITLDLSLIASGLLDSVGTLRLVLFLEKEFHIEVSSSDIVDGKIDTLERIEALVRERTPVV